MVSLIDDYEQQYSILTADITAQIGRLRLVSPSEKKDVVQKINTSIDEAKELLEQLGLEIREAEPNVKPSLLSRYTCYQTELKRLQQEFTNAKTVNTNAGYESFDELEEVSIKDEQQRRLLSNSERIERTGNYLNEGYRIVVETEAMGAQVLQDLHHQRETIQTSRNRLRETNADLGRSSRIINAMWFRGMRDKTILIFVGVVFVVVVVLCIYFSIRN